MITLYHWQKFIIIRHSSGPEEKRQKHWRPAVNLSIIFWPYFSLSIGGAVVESMSIFLKRVRVQTSTDANNFFGYFRKICLRNIYYILFL